MTMQTKQKFMISVSPQVMEFVIEADSLSEAFHTAKMQYSEYLAQLLVAEDGGHTISYQVSCTGTLPNLE